MDWKRKFYRISSDFPKLKIHNQSTSLLKKAVITTMIISTLSFNAITPSAGTDLKTVFHVYMNSEYIGTVSDKAIIEDLVNEKLNDSKDTYKNLQIELGNNLTYIPEQVFHPVVTDVQTTQKVKNALSVKAAAVGIVVNNENVAYVKNEQEAKKVEENLKLKFVSKKDLEKLNLQKKSNKSLAPLKENQSRLLDVSFNEKVSFNPTKIDPSKILSADETVKFLLKGTIEEKKYKVQEGDVLSTIASDHNLTEEKLFELNPGIDENTLLQIGQELNVTVYKPLVHVLVEKEMYKIEKVPYKKEVKEDRSMFKGDTKVIQKGKNGKSALTYRVTEQNGNQTEKNIKNEKVLEKPIKNVIVKGTKVVPSRGSGDFEWPTVGGYISSNVGIRWDKMHKGLDIARPSNRTIKAADNGVVVSAGWDNGGYGNKIVIDHKNGFRTIYAHLASISVSAGETVAKGSKIGVMGATGNVTGVHLHFEVYKNGSLQNPLNYIN